ncbi:DUF4393 domain-containing protein [Streptococcus pyogenes]|uniref:DUF4393 domain-containing protein n=1 Tax=Streptococcus pyogenes TaxID=1314 RepID=UPI0010A0E56F|nr:DUF4393 domain-containing protein [Streptococcus pyogenes]VGQ46778.1 phage protein [Streptococcus pyogenes]VGQ74090.1 phage protein [Streptococcus pyogenes]VGV23478.1 phage protein [Streptococcus pyogenes]
MNTTVSTILVSLGTNLATGAVQKANNHARAIDDLMTLIGFEKIHAWAEKARIKHAADLDDFKHKLAEEILQIATDKLKDPSLNILGPALEASKYHIKQETIRNMFARLIASDIGSSKENLVHSSFVEIIKQLSPLDAQNLSIIFNYKYTDIPVANYYLTYKNGRGMKLAHPDVFLLNPEQNMLDYNSSSLENLRRMGIIEILYNQSKHDEHQYSLLRNNNYLDDIAKHTQSNDPNFQDIYVQPGITRLTYFGQDFCETCLPPK